MKYGLTPGFILRSKCALSFIKKHIKTTEIKFLEIGSGAGGFLKSLLKYYELGVSVDFSASAIEYLNKIFGKYGKRLKIVKEDFFDLNEQFNLIVMFEVIEHIKDDMKGLKKIYSLLKKDGYLLLSTPSRMKNWSYFDIINGHYRRYEKDKLKSKIERTGFEIVEFCSYGWPLLNILLFFNKIIARYKYMKIKKQTNIDKTFLTMQSGVTNRKIFYLLKVLINSYTLFPFVLLQKFGKNKDWGTGYIVLARKGKSIN